MKWLTLERIKANSRIEGNEEDELLKLYGSTAEVGILNLIGRSWEWVCENLSQEDIEGPLTIAGLLLVDHLYKHRGPTENIQTYQIPYSVDFYVKPYMRLTSAEYEQNKVNRYGCNKL